MAGKKPRPRHGKLSIPLDFGDAIRAALNVKPPEKPKRKPRSKHRKAEPKAGD